MKVDQDQTILRVKLNYCSILICTACKGVIFTEGQNEPVFISVMYVFEVSSCLFPCVRTSTVGVGQNSFSGVVMKLIGKVKQA